MDEEIEVQNLEILYGYKRYHVSHALFQFDL